MLKDPRINQIVLTGKVDSDCETRKMGEHDVSKITIRVWNLGYNKETSKREFQPYPLEVKAWNKGAEKLRSLKKDELAVFSGSLEATLWQNRDGKVIPFLFLNATRIETFEQDEKSTAPTASPAPAKKPDPEPETGDLPF